MKKDLFYLKKLFSRPFHAVRAGGQTNRNYIISFRKPLDPSTKFRAGKLGARKFFVRLPWESTVLNRAIEGKNILVLSRNKKVQRILPRYYMYILSRKNILSPKDKNVYNVPDGTMVAEYIPGKELSMGHFKQKKFQQKIAELFHTFHTSGMKFINPYDVFRDEVTKYRREARKHRVEKLFSNDIQQKLASVEREARQGLKPIKKGVSTHNDFLFQNLIVSNKGRIYIVDFEYAGFNQRGGILYDIGYFFVDQLFRTPPMTKQLYDKFLESVDRVYKQKLDRGQVYSAAIAALLVQVWWGAMRYLGVSKKEQPYYKTYTQKRALRIFKLVAELKRKES